MIITVLDNEDFIVMGGFFILQIKFLSQKEIGGREREKRKIWYSWWTVCARNIDG